MRAGAIISAFVHAGVLTWVLLGTPKPFDVASGEPVAVDLVPSEEAPEAPKTDPEPPKPKPEPEKPVLIIPPRDPPVGPTQPPAAAARPQPAAAPQQPAPQPPPAAAPKEPQRSAAVAPPQPAPAQPAPPAPPPSPDAPSIFDPASIPKLMDITPAPVAAAAPGFDALADATVALSGAEIVTFKTHLKKCLALPAGVDAARDMRVVMRVFLKPDGSLAADPMLVAAPAAQEGPAMVKAATQALKGCQPYALPAEKYNEWKTLDIPLTPREMVGG